MLKHNNRKNGTLSDRLQSGFSCAVVSLIVAVGMSSCDDQPKPPVSQAPRSSGNCRTIPHDAGESQVCGQPQKVVTLGPNPLELLLALDIQPIAHAEYFPFPTPRFDQPSQQIPFLGKHLTGQPQNVGTAESPSLDAIAKLKPDIILGDPTRNKDEYALLSQIAPTLLLRYGGTEASWQSNLTVLGQAFKRPQDVTSIIMASDQRLNKLKQDFRPIASQFPKVLLLLSEQLNQEVRIETSNSACGALLEEIGFQVVVPSALINSTEPSQVISLEALPELETDWILIEGYTNEMTTEVKTPEEQQLQAVKKAWRENAIAQSLPASQKGQVYFTPVYLCHALLGPIGTEIFLSDLHQQFQDR